MIQARHRVGIIGAGVIADFHAQALQAIDGVELVAALPEIREKQRASLKSMVAQVIPTLINFLGIRE